MRFDKLEIIAKPVEGKEDRWSVGWKTIVDGEWYGQWIDIPDDEGMIRTALDLICTRALMRTQVLELEGVDSDAL